MELGKLMRDTVSEMDSCGRESDVMESALKGACLMDGVGSAGIYVPESASGQFVLTAWNSLPDWFIASASRIPNSGLEGPSGKDQGEPPVHFTGNFPLSAEGGPCAVMFTAAEEFLELDPKIRLHLQWLAWTAGANLRRIRAAVSSRSSMDRMNALLDRMQDPAAILDCDQGLIYCNRSFRELTRLEELDGSPISFREACGRELHGLLAEALEHVADRGEPASRVLVYGERTYSISLHPLPECMTLVMRDVTFEEDASSRLGFREKFEGLLVNIATDFIEMKGRALNLGINDALLSIGVALEVDRAYLFRFSEDLQEMSNTHEWCASNIQPHMDRLQDLRTSRFPWLMNRLGMHETLRIPRLSDMPDWAEAEREMLEEKDVQSMVAVPIIHGMDLIGFLGFDCVNGETDWSDDILDLLRIVGDAIGNALERNRMEKDMMRMYRRAEKEAQLNAVLLREVNHRVKNNLSEIIGLLYAQKRFSGGDYSDFISNLIGRIRGLATVHEMLSSTGWKPLELTRLAKGIVNSAMDNAPEDRELRASVSSSSITVDSNRAHALALILNELVRNSIKHGLKGRDSLLIKVRMRKDRRGMVSLTYSDDGPGYPEEVIRMERSSLGLDLIQNLTSKNLQGDLTLLNDGGAVARIGFSMLPPEEGMDEEE